MPKCPKCTKEVYFGEFHFNENVFYKCTYLHAFILILFL